MAKKFLTGIDLVQNPVNNAQIQNLASAPSSPVPGQIYWDTTQNQMFYWNATAGAWQWVATNALLLLGQNGAYYLSRANQTGTQLAATISNLQATVIGYTLDTFAAPVASLNLNSQRVINLGAPQASTDAATKGYVDASVMGLQVKPSAQVATAAALPANTYANGTAGVGATLTASSNGVLTVDGYAVKLGDIVLVKNEATTANNGLYNVTTLGTSSAPYVLTRNVDMNSGALFGGALVPVENNGSTTGNTLWLCSAANSITVGTTAVTFSQIASPLAYTASNGVVLTGTNFTAQVVAAGGVLAGSSGLSVDTTVVTRKYAATIGDGTSTSITLTHNLGTLDTTESIYTVSSGVEVECDITHASTNTTTFLFAVAPAAGAYRVVIHG